MRVNFNEGQEVVRADLNNAQAGSERNLLDRILYEMLQRTSDGFFEGSFKATRADSNTLTIAAGLGLQSDGAQVSPEPTKRLIYLALDTTVDVTAPHATLNRTDIVCVRSIRSNTNTQDRRYKATVASLPTLQNVTVETDWRMEAQVVAGIPGGAMAATPAGWLKIAEVVVTAVTGIVDAAAVTDSRTLLAFGPEAKIDTSAFLQVATKAAGTKLKQVLAEIDAVDNAQAATLTSHASKHSLGYDAIVGSAVGCTHAATSAGLTAAIAAAPIGGRILVTESIAMSATCVMNKVSQEIELKPGVILSNGGATTGLSITAVGCRVRGGKMSGFTIAISVAGGATDTMLRDIRFNTNTDDVIDSSEVASVLGCVST